MNTRGDHFKILSLDGGGSWALIQVKALMNLYPEAERGHKILKHFDLAISTSGGSIVLAALAADMNVAETLGLFLDEGVRHTMFVSIPFGPLDKKIGLGPRYQAAAKLDGLRAALKGPGDMRMADWTLTNKAGRPVRLVICGFDYERLRGVFFRTHAEPAETPPIPSQRAVIEATFAQAAHASSNAPLNYFDAPAKFGEGPACFWDGAMGGHNNPVLAGVVEAMRDGTLDRSRVRVLSIGTGSVVLPEVGTVAHGGLRLPRRGENIIAYAKTAGTCVLDDPPDTASYAAHVMLGGRVPRALGDVVSDGPVVRMNPLVQPVRGTTSDWDLPTGLTVGDFRALVELDMDAVEQRDVGRIVTLTDAWLAGSPADPKAVRNQPIRAARWLQVQIGHGTFGAAKSAWKVTDVSQARASPAGPDAQPEDGDEDDIRDVSSSDFGDEPLLDLREGVAHHLFESEWPVLYVTREANDAIFEFEEHIYTKYWEHKYHARTFCEAMLRAIRRLANAGAPFSNPQLDDDDVHLFVRWTMRLDAARPARQSLLAAREAYDVVWQRANAILDDSDSVLLLGKDTGEHMERLLAMKRVLEDQGYYVYVIKEEPNRLGEAVIQKVTRYASSSRFVLIENTEPSGHLYEMPHVAMAKCVIAVLQEQGRGATWMIEDAYFGDGQLRKFEYTRENLGDVVTEAAVWAQAFIREFGEHQKKALPWMKGK